MTLKELLMALCIICKKKKEEDILADYFVYSSGESEPDLGHEYAVMTDEDQTLHIKNLWRKGLRKTFAAVKVINVFCVLNRDLYIYGVDV